MHLFFFVRAEGWQVFCATTELGVVWRLCCQRKFAISTAKKFLFGKLCVKFAHNTVHLICGWLSRMLRSLPQARLRCAKKIFCAGDRQWDRKRVMDKWVFLLSVKISIWTGESNFFFAFLPAAMCAVPDSLRVFKKFSPTVLPNAALRALVCSKNQSASRVDL